MRGPQLTLVIPSYNEQAALPAFLPEVCAACERNDWRLIVVDDGSTDGTADILAGFAERPYLSVVRHKVNRGYGGALKSGIQAASTSLVATIDADGQHYLEDVERLLAELIEQRADMVVGDRRANPGASRYREVGKGLLRFVARLLLHLEVNDLNSGLKIYDTELAKSYLGLCPDSMAFSDVITMVFVSQRHLVIERPIRIKPRAAGTSTITTRTAVETLAEILNIVVLFNPMRLFLPISLASIVLGMLWGLPIVLRGNGVSVGAMLAIVTGVIFFFLGLLAEQIGLLRRDSRS